jgi:hypothetical protein
MQLSRAATSYPNRLAAVRKTVHNTPVALLYRHTMLTNTRSNQGVLALKYPVLIT